MFRREFLSIFGMARAQNGAKHDIDSMLKEMMILFCYVSCDNRTIFVTMLIDFAERGPRRICGFEGKQEAGFSNSLPSGKVLPVRMLSK